MVELLYYLKKLHAYAGKRLYLNFVSMILISMIEGIGIYLLVPMLSLMGPLNLNLGNIPFVSNIVGVIHKLPTNTSLSLILAVYIVLIAGQSVLQRGQQIQSSRINQGFIRLLRLEIYQALLASKWDFFVKKRKSDFNHILTYELARVASGTVLVTSFLTSLVFTGIQIVFAFILSPKLAALVIVCGMGFVLFSRRYFTGSRTLGTKMTELSQSYFSSVNDTFNGIKDIKSNRLERTHITWFSTLNNRMQDNGVHFVKMQSMSQLVYKVASAILIVVFVFISVFILHVKAEQLILIVLIFSRLWPRFSSLQSNVEQIYASIPAFKSLIDLNKECESARELSELTSLQETERIEIDHSITCDHVYFRYDRSQSIYALKDIKLTIPVNQTTAIVGKSGAGKSTLIDILIGLFQPEGGRVLLDGIPLTSDNLQAYRSAISYVSQDPFLFNASIRDNLTMVAPNVTDEWIWEALKFASADDFVRRLPAGIDTVLGDRGIRLSGGERQRIVLARAILRKPAILVLDEATSALDNENEAQIQSALERLKGNMTIVIIAHRLSTIRNADQVIVLDKGEIVQQGGYQQLSEEKNGTFGKLLAYQLGVKKEIKEVN